MFLLSTIPPKTLTSGSLRASTSVITKKSASTMKLAKRKEMIIGLEQESFGEMVGAAGMDTVCCVNALL